MQIHIQRFSLLLLVGLTLSARADTVAVGTNLSPCVGGPGPYCGTSGYGYILPGQFVAQGFVLKNTTTVSNIFLTIGRFAVPVDPSNPVQIDYASLGFDLALTTSIGAGTTPSNVLTSSALLFPSPGPQITLMSLLVNQVLVAGTYYLVASTSTPIPNASKALAWGEANSYYPNTGQALGASGVQNGNSSIWDELKGCPQSDCRPRSFAPASAFIPVSGPAAATPFELQVCSQDNGTGCGQITTDVPPSQVPEPSSLPVLCTGLLGAAGITLLRKCRKRMDLVEGFVAPRPCD